MKAHTGLKDLNEMGAKLLILVPGAGLEPARTLAGPRDFKSRVSTNSTIRAAGSEAEGVRLEAEPRHGKLDYTTADGNENSGWKASRC